MWRSLNKIVWVLLAVWFGYAFGAEAVDHAWLGQTAFSLNRNDLVTHSMLWMPVLGVIIAAACWTHLKAQSAEWDHERAERSRRYTEWREAWDARLEAGDEWERAGEAWDSRLESGAGWERVEFQKHESARPTQGGAR